MTTYPPPNSVRLAPVKTEHTFRLFTSGCPFMMAWRMAAIIIRNTSMIAVMTSFSLKFADSVSGESTIVWVLPLNRKNPAQPLAKIRAAVVAYPPTSMSRSAEIPQIIQEGMLSKFFLPIFQAVWAISAVTSGMMP